MSGIHILVIILLMGCFVEAYVIFKDNGVVANKIIIAKEMAANEGWYSIIKPTCSFIIRHIIGKFRKLFGFPKEDVTYKSNNTKNTDDILIAIQPAGGYGDYLLFANWLYYFMKKYKNDPLKIDVYYHIKSATTIFNYNIKGLRCIYIEDYPLEYSNYDIVYKICKFPELVHVDKNRLNLLKPSVLEYVDLSQKFVDENILLFEKHPELDGWASYKSILLGKKRIQEPDIYSFLGITEEYKYKIEIDEDEVAYLDNLGLSKQKFITVHRGWDGTIDKEHVKAWSLTSCGDIVKKLKDNIDEYKIVLIGASIKQAPNPDGADLNLVGKTTLEQVKILLKNSIIHIDNEGGMVHLRHALHGGASIVTFGPTSIELFGYSENKNIESHYCEHWCEWATNKWQYNCSRGFEGAPCMELITSEMIVKEVKKLLFN